MWYFGIVNGRSPRDAAAGRAQIWTRPGRFDKIDSYQLYKRVFVRNIHSVRNIKSKSTSLSGPDLPKFKFCSTGHPHRIMMQTCFGYELLNPRFCTRLAVFHFFYDWIEHEFLNCNSPCSRGTVLFQQETVNNGKDVHFAQVSRSVALVSQKY